MEVDEEFPSIYCHKINIETYKPLRITTSDHEDRTCIILWNEFSILLYESNKLSDPPIIYNHECSIVNVQSTHNILLFNDSEKAIHFTILRRDDRLIGTIRFKRIFEDAVKLMIDDGRILTLNRKRNELWLYVFNLIDSSKFKIHKKYKLKDDSLNVSNVHLKPLQYFTSDFLRCALHLNTNTVDLNTSILFVTTGDIIYYCTLDGVDVNLSMLYTCPASITDICCSSSKLYLLLNTGSAIVLSADVEQNCTRLDTIHLNCSMLRVILKDESIIYTDYDKLWLSTTLMSEKEIDVKHKLLTVRNVYDFVFVARNNFIYCISLNNLLYSFNLVYEDVSKDSESENGFIPIPKSLKDTRKIFESILDEMKQNELILNTIVDEDHLITTIAMSEKQDLSLQNLHTSVKICAMNDIEDDSILVTDLRNYYRQNTTVYLIEFKMSEEFRSKLKDFLKSSTQTWYLNIGIKDDVDQSTISVILTDCQDLRIAVPMNRKINIPSEVHLKLISLIPDVINNQVQSWCTFPSKPVLVGLKYHIEINAKKNLLKRKSTKLMILDEDDKIVGIAMKHSALICNVYKEQITPSSIDFSHFLRIPEPYNSYGQKFTERFVEYLKPKFVTIIADKLNNSLDKLKNFQVSVQDVAVEFDVVSDGTMKKIRISTSDCTISWRMYLFFFECFLNFSDVDKHRSMPHFDFMKLQNIKHDINTIITSNSYSTDDIYDALIRLSEEFSHILGLLPL
ncbi:uncharacterized protein LOC143908929 [Arctopsyche grandis]|uniref:uncharacterized protein LOC143908929 n=1 Tax=Arctopsyche grandis TaxID=121162 RepID=UPI00406D68FF